MTAAELEAENLLLRTLLAEFMAFQISDYDRMANRAKDYCTLRRRARVALSHVAHGSDCRCGLCVHAHEI